MTALVVDDHPLARRGLAAIMADALGMVEVWEADSVEGALALAGRLEPDLVVFDAPMPGTPSPRDVCARLRAAMPDAAMLLFTAACSRRDIRDCLAAGADGCVLKDNSEADIAAALRATAAGETVIDPRVAHELASELVQRAPSVGRLQLTGRERDVLEQLSAGCTNRAIAARLALSEATVKGYVSSLLAKLGASSRLEAVVRASDAGLMHRSRNGGWS